MIYMTSPAPLLAQSSDTQTKSASPWLYLARHFRLVSTRSVKNRISNICRISNKNPNSNAKRCIQILGVRQASWHTK